MSSGEAKGLRVWEEPFRQVSTHVLPAIEQSLNTTAKKDFTVLRVSQLDANELDTQLAALLASQLKKIWPRVHDTYEPEIQLALQSLMWYLSVFKTGATYGLQLMGLKYRDERRHWADPVRFEDAFPTLLQRLGWWLGHVGLRYAWTRVHRVSLREQWSELEERDWRKRVWRLMEWLEKAHTVLTLLNFLTFLSNGRYRSLVDRVLCMRLVYVRRQMNRQVDFEFLNRQLVWQGFTEFILFLMPFVSFQGIKGSIMRMLPNNKSTQDTLPPHICAICTSTTIHTPHVTNCGHTFCYYCIKSAIMADSSYSCPRCGTIVETVERVSKV